MSTGNMRQGGDVLAGNYIKINRSLLDWEWYKDINTKVLFLHMLLKANWGDFQFMGMEIKRGSFVSSIKHLSAETGLSEKQVRTAILHLKRTGEVASQSTNRFTVFTVNNYDLYQEEGRPEGEQKASKGQARGKQRATIEEDKEDKEDKYNKKSVRFTPPDFEEVKNYCTERNNNVDPQSFIDFYSSKGWMVGKNKMKDWKASVRTWERRKTDSPKTGTPKKKNFNNFERRKYDMDSLEDQLLGR